MKPLELVVFGQPIPIPRTHRREPQFDAADGWTILRDDAGDFHISGHGVIFVTDGIVSWVEAPVGRAVVTAIDGSGDSVVTITQEMIDEDAKTFVPATDEQTAALLGVRPGKRRKR